jgi:hypothetical protein
MASEKYLNTQQTHNLFLLRNKLQLFDRQTLSEMGLEWVYQRIQYQIVDEKKWLFARLKYGI